MVGLTNPKTREEIIKRFEKLLESRQMEINKLKEQLRKADLRIIIKAKEIITYARQTFQEKFLAFSYINREIEKLKLR